ncbi:MAG: amino acid adenylation domain-containing protein [Oscillospiraceae bacterium]|nr:amino acid adenylation domain-containing protein [Oscillospiraceae bacterium]
MAYQSIVQWIMQNVSQYPAQTVIVDQGENNFFTYSSFDVFARKIAAKLIRQGICRGDFVTVELPRNKEYIAAMYAVWLAGGAYAPLSPDYPEDRLAYIRSDCSAKAVINERFLHGIESETPLAEPVIPDADAPAVLIYTSGSTGKPKGVLHTQRSIAGCVQRYRIMFDAPQGTHSAMGTPLTFVVAVGDVFEPLCSCKTIYIMPQQTMRDPVLLADFIEENQIEHLFISPKMLKVFKNRSASLKSVYTGSERVSGIFSEDYAITVCYGQTESTGAITAFPLDRKYDNSPIGKPVGDACAYVLDDNGNEADEGELCLAGWFASEYLHLPEQSERVFTENPFREKDGFDRLLHTGDLVRRGEGGNFIYLNRRDWMVKINGQRVEPGEIEAVIRNCEGIADAAIKDFTNDFGQVYLTAYYTETSYVDVRELKAAIGAKLPSYMIPAFFVRLDRMPVNANGKLDRSALLAPEAGSFKNDYIAPETDMQKALCSAFSNVLGVENVGVDDDFFAMGGDSIKCVMVTEECDIYKIPVSVIFEGKTPRMIERIMLQKVQNKPFAKKTEKPRIYPLTPYERGMYLEQKLDASSVVYNLNLAVTVRGADSARVQQAAERVFSAHEAFHSYYGEQNGLPVRILTDETPVIAVKQAASREQAISEIENDVTPFDLNVGIPVRPTVYEIPDGSVILHLAIHHIAFDGGSVKTLMQELFAALNGKEITAGEIDLSDLYEESHSHQSEDGLSYYREMFADGVPVADLPLKGSRPRIHPLSDRQIDFCFEGDALKKLDRAARRSLMTEFELLFSAVSMVLGQYAVSEDVVLGIPTNMRPVGADSVIGMFVNTAPVRVKPVRSMDLAAYLQSVSSAVRATTYSASLPFEKIVSEFVKQRDESRNPIFDVSVNYMQQPPAYSENGISAELYVPLQKMGRDIGFVFRRSGDCLYGSVQYSSQLFEDDVIGNFVAQLRSSLEQICGGTAFSVSDALTLPADQAEKLEAFSEEARADIPVKLLHRLFEQSAAENPDKTAVIAKDRTMTFRELNECANVVANKLIEKGIGVGDSAALLLPRESSFFCCMFGVNKAGAAFIPCDPQYPADRINHIIEDSGASFIITTADKLADYPSEKAIDVTELLSGTDTSDPAVEMTGDELSYMIYTSGSTGKPKGVMLRHVGICNYLMPEKANTHMYYLKHNISNYLSVTTVSFDMSFKEHTAALCNGKTLIFASEDEMNDPRALAQLMEQYGADCINATPSRLQQYLDYAPFRAQLAKCRLVMSGGEGYPMSLRDAIKACAPGIRIMNTYGPTEITVSCNAADLTDAGYVTVGRPLLNYKEYIIDKFGAPVPYGVIGELYVGGIGVAEGYRNLPEKTAASFVEYNGQRMYRTGDQAKFDRNGNVYILGRLDNQVKLRGLRIELGEIEGLIAAQPHIKKVAVVIRPFGGQDNLCAYFTADTEINIDALRDELKKQLTHYMVPTAYLQMNELPMTANGKTDIKRLPDPMPVNVTEYVAPANETERFFCDAFANALNLDKVGANDDFFEIGGTSLIVTSIVIAASEQGYDLTYGDVFKNTTPRALAKLFADGNAEQKSKSLFDFDAIDYTGMDALLAQNTIEAFRNGETRQIGNILVTGATGYMGAHLLAQYLDEETGTAWCLIRKGKYPNAASRLKTILFYYFGSKYNSIFDERVKAVDGDVTDYQSFVPFETLPINTVFNCAANVKHFSSGTDIEDINVGGAENCVTLCRKTGAALVHFSTISVGGTTDDLRSLSRTELDEQSLYFGQTLDNKYTASKLMGEIAVLRAAAEGAITAKVIRVGTLAARESDGEFQINFVTNSFMGRLRSYSLLGCFPYQMLENQACMGPIDVSCRAFLKLARTPKECCLFNAVNNHTIPLGDIIRRMNAAGMDIRFTEYEDFAAAVSEAEKDPDKAAILQSLIAYMGHSNGSKTVEIPFVAHYTTQILARMGFFWNPSNEKYIDDFINVLRGFTFFSKDNLSR